MGSLPVSPPRKLPWVPIAAVAGGLVLVLAFAFRDQLLGPSDAEQADAADTEGEVAEPEPEPTPEPETQPEPEPEPEPAPEPPAIDPAELEAKITEATSLVNRQKYDDARVIIDEVLAKIPAEGRALALLAQTQLEKGKLEDALTTANTCVGADPNQSFCWITVATVEQANENFPRALEAYRKYLEVEPDGQHAKSAKKQAARLESKVEG
ncbi:Beta-barrel assembly-enhancing protease [Enhygromyxa salina]|uniref:Beta-barrel assembly-enhancing protease n=2 Tax=Enhygromyxa salina TaxID=215803 RepID=A0A2S9YAZ8_9BACT|nr:Beta-barrel assembly-enhancing protease [Enhygromyxa salina]